MRYQDDLVDQLFNSSEKRLARVLLLMAHFGKEGVSEMSVPRLSQETLAEMVGTTRSRVSFFMNRFRKLGFINYDVGHNLRVHSSLLNVVLHDDALDDESRIARGDHGREPSVRRGGTPESERARRPPLSSPKARSRLTRQPLWGRVTHVRRSKRTNREIWTRLAGAGMLRGGKAWRRSFKSK